MLFLKSLYVRLMHAIGALLKATGLVKLLDRKAKTSRTAHWVRSLFSIYDIEGMIALDVPWWTYAAIDEVDAFLASRPDARVFEFGSGASTVWLARRAAQVTSVEHHEGWHARVQSCLDALGLAGKTNLTLVQTESLPASDPIYVSEKAGEGGKSFEAYARAIETHRDGPFDVIVIDGRVRAACLQHAKGALAEGGMIVFDNSHRQRYRRAIEGSDFDARVLKGLTPTLPYSDETTLLRLPLR